MNKFKGEFEKAIVKQLTKACESNEFHWFYEPVTLEYYEIKKYTPDFLIETEENAILIEAKGYLRPEDRRKMVAIKKQYPDMDIRFLFQNANNKLNKNSKMTYGQWADRHGFLWANKEIPEEWLRV